MKVNKAVYTCDVCKKEFKDGFSFYGTATEILNGNEGESIIKVFSDAKDQAHICSVCIPKTFNFVQTGIR